MKIGTVIIVKAWGKFSEKVMTCVGTETDKQYGNRYVFDTGLKLSESNLKSNFALWESRNGYEIIENK